MNSLDWLLDSDPSIRWQAMRNLLGEPEAVFARERSRVANAATPQSCALTREHSSPAPRLR
jgi:hypothetical protein